MKRIKGKEEFPLIASQLIPPLILLQLNGDFIESNKVMFSILTDVLQKNLASMGTQLHELFKCQMKQVNKLTGAVTQLTSLHNANTLAARSIADQENSENSDSGEDDVANDGRNRVTIHKTDRSLETSLAASFLSHKETSSSSVAKTSQKEMIP